MNRLTLSFLAMAVLAPGVAVCQSTPARAVRADGSAVLLYADGTWRADSASKKASAGAKGGGRQKPASASKRLSILKRASLSFDPDKWRQTKSEEAGRINLRHETGDGYALVIAERTEIEPDALVSVALGNARTAAPDAKVVMDEKRVVNGVPIRSLQIKGTVQGIKFRYFNYYYAGSAGSIQVITYTSENLFEEYASDFQELLDGFEVAQ